MGIGEIFSGESPERQYAELDPLTKKLIQDQVNDALTPVGQKYGKIDADIAKDQGVFDDQPGFGFLNEAPVGEAIKQKYAAKLSPRIEQIKAKERLNIRDKQIDSMKNASTALIAQSQVQSDIYSKMLEAHRMREEARSGAINSILGFGGAVVGYNLAPDDQKKKKPSVGVSKATEKPNMGPRDMMNDAPGAEKSQNYREDLRGIGDMERYA